MTLFDFLLETQAEVRAPDERRVSPTPNSSSPRVVMQHLADVGMTFDPVVCHYQAEVGRGPRQAAHHRVRGLGGDGPA
jgi:hypothetical protein